MVTGIMCQSRKNIASTLWFILLSSDDNGSLLARLVTSVRQYVANVVPRTRIGTNKRATKTV